MPQADSDLILWLIEESNQSITEISEGSGVAWSTVSDLKKKRTSVSKMSLENATKLTSYAKRVKNS